MQEANAGKPRLYWLHSFLLVLLTSFGGGWVAPWLLGLPSIPVANDVVVPLTLIIWYLTYNPTGVYSLLTLFPVKLAWTVFVGLFRTHAVCNMVNVASSTLKAGPYYSVPLVGPIIAGTALGSMGQFIPFDKGLVAISAGVPWPIQGAFLSALFYHLMVNDAQGLCGNTFRAVFGTYSEQTVRIIIATVQIATLLLQAVFSPTANLLTPVHKLLYLVFQVQGPLDVQQKPKETIGWDYNTRLALERAIELGRILIVLLVLAVHIYLTAPPTVLLAATPVGKGITWGRPPAIALGSSVGTCQMFAYVRDCQPHHLILENVAADAAKGGVSLQFASYPAPAKKWYSSTASSSGKSVWQRSISKKPVLAEGTVSARLDQDGTLRVVSSGRDDQQEEALWTSSTRCKAKAAATEGSPVYLTLDAAGRPVVHCADGSVVAVN